MVAKRVTIVKCWDAAKALASVNKCKSLVDSAELIIYSRKIYFLNALIV